MPYQVINTETGKVHAKHTTKKKAMAQKRILEEAEEKSPIPTPPSSPKGKKSSWISFWASKVKGKKFKSRSEINAYMKEMAKEFKGSKSGTGEELLLDKDHGVTPVPYTQSFDVRTQI